MKNFLAQVYGSIVGIIMVISFLGCWIYCIATYGFLLGVGFGWVPSLIVTYLVVALLLSPFYEK
jgi:hypothetical protein